MITRFLVLLTIFLLAACSSDFVQIEPRNDVAMHEVVTNQSDFSGHIIVADQEVVLFNKVYGESGAGSDMSFNERWRWASVTKQIVAVAILQMVEEGHFNLDSVVADVIPEVKVANANQMTIRNLLQHTSGLINDASLPGEAFINGFDSRSFCKGPATNPPSQSFEYNNCDYVVLGQVIEGVDKKPWFDSLQTRIFSPAGMTSLRIGPNNGDETVSGFISKGIAAPDVTLPLYEASGELVGTVEDLLKFDRALFSGVLLKAKTRELMWVSDPSLGYAALGQWVFPGQLEGCDAPLQLVERRGAISGVQVLNVLVPEKEISVIVFVNRDDFDWGAVWAKQGFAFDLLSAALCGG